MPGRGSVFSLALPTGTALCARQSLRVFERPVTSTLAGRLIVVVEDEPAVRKGFEAMLQSWGAVCLSFASTAMAEAWASGSDPAPQAPSLLIVDHLLGDGDNGLAAIAALRSRFGAGLPAIVVTGSSMASHEQAAVDHDFHVLIKPVLPNRLRAMIAFKLG